jgi:hypothetical protein
METSPGVWENVSHRDDFWRCSRFATDWGRDVTELAPGASMTLDDLLDPSVLLDFPRSGTVRLYAHYEYDGGRRSSSRSQRPPLLPKELEDVGSFALVSAPLVLRVNVDTSVELALVLRRQSLHVGERVSVAELADLGVVNRTGAPLDLGEDFPDHRFHLDVKEDDRGGYLQHGIEGPRQLEPRARVALQASPETKIWSDTAATMRVRLRFAALDRHRYHSAWLDVAVVP